MMLQLPLQLQPLVLHLPSRQLLGWLRASRDRQGQQCHLLSPAQSEPPLRQQQHQRGLSHRQMSSKLPLPVQVRCDSVQQQDSVAPRCQPLGLAQLQQVLQAQAASGACRRTLQNETLQHPRQRLPPHREPWPTWQPET